MPTATSTTSQPGQRRPASRESKDTRAGRLLYNINTRDQITDSEHGGPLHVSGTLNRPGKIASTGSSETPTALDGSFSAWIDAPASGPATVSAQDYSSNFVNTPTAPSYNTGLQRAYTFTYDANGNMTSKTPVGGGATVYYTWDAMDRLVEVSTGSSYEYDGLGRRVRINQTSGQPDPRDFRFVWDGLKPVRALGMLEDIPLEVVYYDQGMFILLDNEPYHYIYTQKDHLGSNRNGYAYDAYGNLTDWDNEAPPWFERLYTGHLYDASAGLYLAPYRSYDPELGRWLSREPLGLDGPNLYHYVFNDPGNGIDKTGLFREYVFDPYLYSDFGYYYFDTIRNMFTDGWIDGSLNGQITRYVPPQSQNLARNAMWGSLAVSGAATGGAGYLVGGEALGSCGIYNVGAIVTRRAAAKAAGAHGRHYSETLTRELLRNGVRSKGEGWNQYLIRFKDGQGEIAWRWTDRTVVHHNPFKFYR